jgi:hypothetical protein
MQTHDLNAHICDTIESLHLRLCALESDRGAFSIKPVLDNTQTVLKTLQKIQNYENTIRQFVNKLQTIQSMCQAPNPNWLGIMGTILDLLSDEDAQKAERDESIIQTIETNLLTLNTLQQVAEIEYRDQHHLSDQVHLGVGAALVFDTINDVRGVLNAVRHYEQTIKGISLKYKLLHNKLKDFRWDNPMTIVQTCIDIIQIIQEEDIEKKHREDKILEATKKSVIALQNVTESMSRLNLSANLNAEAGVQLGNPFSMVLGTIGQVLQGVDAIINHQRTIDQICGRYQLVMQTMQRLVSVSDIKQVIPCLIDLVRILNDEDTEKLKRDWDLIHTMQSQNDEITKITSALGGLGYTIC